MAFTTKASDSFNRGNGPIDSGGRQTLDNANGGSGTWTWVDVVADTWSISGTDHVVVAGGSTSIIHADGTTGSNDQGVEAKALSTTVAEGVVARWTTGTGVGNCYMLYWDEFNSNTLFLFRGDNGSFTQLATASYTLSVNDVMRLEIIGSALTGYINGVSKVTGSDSTYASGVGGLYGDPAAGGSFDDFKYEEQAVVTRAFLLVRH